MDLDPIIHSLPRLRIMRLLAESGLVTTTQLGHLTDLTPGNLHSHCTTLEQQGYIKRRKILQHEKMVAAIQITTSGLREFNAYLSKLAVYLEKTKYALRGNIEQIKYSLPPSVFCVLQDPDGNRLGIATFE